MLDKNYFDFNEDMLVFTSTLLLLLRQDALLATRLSLSKSKQ